MDPATAASLEVDPERMRREVDKERAAQGVNFEAARAGLHFGLGALRIDQGEGLLQSDRGKGEDLIRRGIGEVEQAAKMVPLPPYLRRLAAAYALLGQTTQAEKIYRAALLLAGSDFALHYDLAGLLYEMGRYPQALAEMQAARTAKARLNPPELADYHFGMGLLRLDGYRDRDRALYHFRKALEANPDHREKARMAELISELSKSGAHPQPED